MMWMSYIVRYIFLKCLQAAFVYTIAQDEVAVGLVCIHIIDNASHEHEVFFVCVLQLMLVYAEPSNIDWLCPWTPFRPG